MTDQGTAFDGGTTRTSDSPPKYILILRTSGGLFSNPAEEGFHIQIVPSAYQNSAWLAHADNDVVSSAEKQIIAGNWRDRSDKAGFTLTGAMVVRVIYEFSVLKTLEEVQRENQALRDRETEVRERAELARLREKYGK